MRLTLTAALLVIGCGDGKPKCDLPDLTEEGLAAVRDAFNRDADRPRAIMFFSSACTACDTGAEAVQTMLEQRPDPLTVFAVWEPVKKGDAPPTSKMLANLQDPRVQQLWDPKNLMSMQMRLAELKSGGPPQARARTHGDPDGVMYDTMIMFRPGKRWEDTLPLADFMEPGIEARIDAAIEELERARAR